MKYFLILALLIFPVNFYSKSFPDTEINILFIIPVLDAEKKSEKNAMFNDLQFYAEKASRDLNINLTTLNYEVNFQGFTEKFKKQIKSQKPDAIIFTCALGLIKKLTEISEEEMIPYFTINTKFNEKYNMGKPGQKYKYWLGEMTPDDEYAGYILAKVLAENAPAAKDGLIHMVAMSGINYDRPSGSRLKGLKKYLCENKNIVLEQIFETSYLNKTAAEKFYLIKKSRYPDTTAVWAASDGIASGVCAATKELKLEPGNDVIIGGIDWTKGAVESIRKKEIFTSVGGHVLEGAWSVVLLHDYLKGIDFRTESTQFTTKMKAITRNDIYLYSNSLPDRDLNKISFKNYSKFYNKKLEKYNFELKKQTFCILTDLSNSL